ncbi:MAG: hypothetical protein ACOYM1_10755 [Methylovulum sp.]
MSKLKDVLTSRLTLVTGAIATAIVAPSAFAVTASETAISAALTQGETIVGLIGPGIIGIAALMLGVGLVVSWIKK